jgi:hypothetical protein
VNDLEGGEPSPEVPPTEETGAAVGEQPAPPERRPSRWLIVVAAALLVVATFLGVLAARFKAQLDDERDDQRSAQEVAARFAANFVTYDYRNPDASLERITTDATPSFARDFEAQFRAEVLPGIAKAQAQSSGEVQDVYLSSIEEGSASAFVLVNVVRQGVGGRLPVAGTYFRVDLVERAGEWKVENVLSINFAEIAADPATPGQPGATTTTSAAR